MKKLAISLALAFTIVGAVFALNFVSAGQPVSKALASDPRNRGFELSGHLGNYVNTSTLVLNLKEAKSAAPVDLWRGLFQVAEAFHERNRRFSSVILAREGTAVFTIDGADFAELGSEFSAGQNPIYLIRKLPEKLRTPEGGRAYEPSYSGWIVALGEEMSNVSDAATKWASTDQ
jgi:hypothetical protein